MNPRRFTRSPRRQREQLGGTLSPSAFADLRLITSSNLVACITGRSAGFRLAEMANIYAGLRYASVRLLP